MALVMGLLSSLALVDSAVPASAAVVRNAAWPAQWQNPLSGTGGGTVGVTSNFGAYSLGCSNADRSHGYTYYLDSGYAAHLALDLNLGEDQPVFAIAAGTVIYTGQKWGAANRDVVLVQHQASDGSQFVATYGHVHSEVSNGQTVSAGQRIGRVWAAGTGAHLHFGLKPGTGTTEQPTIPDARSSGSSCSLAKNTSGMVDPIGWLSGRNPSSAPVQPDPPDSVSPIGAIDDARRAPGGVRMRGWTFDQSNNGSIGVHFYGGTGTAVNGNPGFAYTANQPRGDVGQVYGPARTNSGFNYVVPFPYGQHRVCAYGINVGLGYNRRFACTDVNVSPDPFGDYASVVRWPGGVRASGWVIDPDTASPTSVHAYAGTGTTSATNPSGAVIADLARPDVGAAYPDYGANHAFGVFVPVAPGNHNVCVYGINAGAGSANPQLGCRTITVSGNPFGNLESVAAHPGGLRISGWAIDPDTANPIDVHVYGGSGTSDSNINPSVSIRGDQTRSDVATAHPGYGAAHGYDYVIPFAAGPHTVCSYGINTTYGSNSQTGCRSATAPGASSGRYVTIAHRLFLNRYATAAEVSTWMAALDGGTSRAEFTRQLSTSPEWVTAQLRDLYRIVLGREPDASGVAYWRGRIQAGMRLTDIAAQFYGAPEYFARVGGTNTAFVNSLYENILRRTADAGGRNHWVAQLDAGASRVSVAAGFYGSIESRRDRVDRLYRALLGRGPDPGGHTYWADQLIARDDIILAAELGSSAEFYDRAQTRL